MPPDGTSDYRCRRTRSRLTVDLADSCFSLGDPNPAVGPFICLPLPSPVQELTRFGGFLMLERSPAGRRPGRASVRVALQDLAPCARIWRLLEGDAGRRSPSDSGRKDILGTLRPGGELLGGSRRGLQRWSSPLSICNGWAEKRFYRALPFAMDGRSPRLVYPAPRQLFRVPLDHFRFFWV